MDAITSTGLTASLLVYGLTGICITEFFEDQTQACDVDNGYGSTKEWIRVYYYTMLFIGFTQCICYKVNILIFQGYVIWSFVTGLAIYVIATVGKKCVLAERALGVFSLISFVQISILFTIQTIIRAHRFRISHHTEIIHDERPIRITDV